MSLLNLYLDTGTRYIPSMKSCSTIGIRTETSQRINAVYCSRGIYLCIFNYKSLFLCVKDRASLKVSIPAYCFNFFGSIFGVFFFLLIIKWILGSKTIWQSMRKFLCAVWIVRTSSHMDKEERFFYWKLYIDMVWFF